MGVVQVALDRDSRKVEVLAVVPDADESFLELDKFESCDVFRVTFLCILKIMSASIYNLFDCNCI